MKIKVKMPHVNEKTKSEKKNGPNKKLGLEITINGSSEIAAYEQKN